MPAPYKGSLVMLEFQMMVLVDFIDLDCCVDF